LSSDQTPVVDDSDVFGVVRIGKQILIGGCCHTGPSWTGGSKKRPGLGSSSRGQHSAKTQSIRRSSSSMSEGLDSGARSSPRNGSNRFCGPRPAGTRPAPRLPLSKREPGFDFVSDAASLVQANGEAGQVKIKAAPDGPLR
jgi:hypothetical protein